MGLGKIVSKVTGGILGGGGGGGTAAPPPPDFSELEKLKDKTQKQAADFRTNMAGMQSDADRSSRVRGRADLASELYVNKANSNNRGMLFSGIKQAGDSAANSGIASRIAQESAMTKSGLEDQATSLEDMATAAGIGLQKAKAGLADSSFETALANRQARNQGMMAMGQGIGSVAGQYYGSQSQQPQVPNTIAPRKR